MLKKSYCCDSSSKKHPQTSSEQIERQRAPFQNINSSLNAVPQVAPKHKPALPAMSYRAAPVLSPAKEQYERRFHTSPVKVTAPVGYQPPTYQQSAQQLSDFGGPMDEQIMGLHDRRGRLNPTAVQVGARSLRPPLHNLVAYKWCNLNSPAGLCRPSDSGMPGGSIRSDGCHDVPSRHGRRRRVSGDLVATCQCASFECAIPDGRKRIC